MAVIVTIGCYCYDRLLSLRCRLLLRMVGLGEMGGDTELHTASRKGDAAKVERLLKWVHEKGNVRSARVG